jgi:hypothetical protein
LLEPATFFDVFARFFEKAHYISALRLDAAFMASPSLVLGFFLFISL